MAVFTFFLSHVMLQEIRDKCLNKLAHSCTLYCQFGIVAYQLCRYHY